MVSGEQKQGGVWGCIFWGGEEVYVFDDFWDVLGVVLVSMTFIARSLKTLFAGFFLMLWGVLLDVFLRLPL